MATAPAAAWVFELEGKDEGTHSLSDNLIFHMPERLATKAMGWEEEEGGGQDRETGRSGMTHERWLDMPEEQKKSGRRGCNLD